MASIQVTEGLLMDLGWEITAKNGRTVSVEPPQDGKPVLRCFCADPPLFPLCNGTRRMICRARFFLSIYPAMVAHLRLT